MNSIVLEVLGSIVAFVAAAVFMEFVARTAHKHVMHRLGWCLHYDHHNASGRVFQKNDLYALIFAVPSFLLIFFGLRNQWYIMAAAGFGVALYGVGYILFHDIMFHGRIKSLKFKPKHPYLKRIINAHRVHHAAATKGGAISFSFLWAPRKYGPDNQAEVNQTLAEIREIQLALRRREKERAAEAAESE